MEGGLDRLCLCRGVDDVSSALAALLAHAYVDDGQGEGCGFHDAAGRITDHAGHVGEKAPIGDCFEVDVDVRVGARGGELPGALDERVAAGVGVGVDEDELAGGSGEHGEESVSFSVGVSEDGDGVPGGEDGGRRESDAELGFDCIAVEKDRTGEVVEGGCAGVMNSAWLFAHGDDSAARGGRGGEVDGCEFGEGVADVVIDGALGDFAAFNVSDGDAQREGNGGWGEHLIAVGDEQQNVRAPGGKRVGKTEDGEADGLGHTGVGVGTEQALDAGLDGEAVALDFFDGGTEVGREMGAENEDGEVDFRVHGEFAQRPVEVAIVCAGGGDDADAALGAGNTH